jgi:agmatinase
VLKLVHGVAARGLAGIEIVECSPPYDNAEITSLMGVRVIADVLGALVNHGHLPRTRETA